MIALRTQTGNPEVDQQMNGFMQAWQQEAAGFEMGDGFGAMPEDMEVARASRDTEVDACLCRTQAWMQSYSEKLRESGFDDDGLGMYGYSARPERPEYTFNTAEPNPFLGHEAALQEVGAVRSAPPTSIEEHTHVCREHPVLSLEHPVLSLEHP